MQSHDRRGRRRGNQGSCCVLCLLSYFSIFCQFHVSFLLFHTTVLKFGGKFNALQNKIHDLQIFICPVFLHYHLRLMNISISEVNLFLLFNQRTKCAKETCKSNKQLTEKETKLKLTYF